ncbi:Sugar kinase of the NBD/HSP70 family, may contain an N-terminal HTH domain [Sanguibacter gelidistatuariae]|uniref:Sugar kinase of the NBD/HSP70 family, may contain an N-terminal HTH domain n=1 Tax=Sanguibacter gelidistatuariae TaxID=1814289 RepID=A0A1G6KY93_9MICO|nr:Sugar kinase of the NBD/HSP70 family, may contain an N-terminal HTH domain [Sanguibacter gelidistatuariae]
MTPGSQTSLREANRARIVSAVQQRGSLTQVELAGVTGLSPATISNIVKELAGAGVLSTAPTSRSGRRALQVTLARNLGLVAGIHFGSRSLRVAVADTAHQIIAEQRMPLPPDHRADAGMERAALLLTELVEQVDAPLEELLAVGVGVPAPVDVRTGRVSALGLLRGWEGFSVSEELTQRLGVAVHVDNDANLGALAEARVGAASGFQHVVYIRVSHGVGAGLILNGQVFHGRSGTVGEIGHLTVEDHGPICRCGSRGCLEMYVGASLLLDMLTTSHGNLTLPEAIHLAQNGDLGCRRVISDAGQHLGVAAASICNFIDPELLVIGGELAQAGDLLLDPIRAVLGRRSIPSFDGPVGVVASALGSQAEVRGALLLAMDHAKIAAPMGGGL